MQLHRRIFFHVTADAGALLVIFVLALAPLYAAESVTVQQLLQWCEGKNDASPEQIINGCTAVVQLGSSTEKNMARAYSNRADAYRSTGEYDRAIEDFDRAIQLDSLNALAYSNRGFTHFFKADFSAAAADFLRSLELQEDAYSLLGRYLARKRADGTGAEELAASAAHLDGKQWPYPVIEFYLGRRSAGEMWNASATSEERCEAQFYLGEWHLLGGNRADAAAAFRTAAQTCPMIAYEYNGAIAELQRLSL